ncbi:Crp/Fnr family transcriptional regulator [Rhizobium sp. P38BS-XIX]|uniref:Crp/Fnr family transcriptional regulator n=1 Tax=Rhizobium sp. P38BS-XIX TaxID=2726740 RepID=UPI001456FBCB|nr:Crp/Fnr family transcriptional regulator [Rhizobium sp. P38BS-XIX]NLS00404.1 Crp/Fnr family transcriptional regulator [Rhizobium sp. P38BS-XIX]
MPAPQQSMMQNKLLSILPSPDYEQIAPGLERVVLPRGTLLGEAGQPIDYVYFLTTGIGSIIATTPEGRRAEAGVFGFDGYVPTSAVAGTEFNAHDVIIQLDAEAYRMDYDLFRHFMEKNRNLNKLMIRSIEAFAVQLAYTAISNALHEVSERLARWLLMCHDRVSGNEIALTHEFISLMLAVRRPSVTTSLHVLEGNGFILSQRGNITIRNRPALEEFAHDAYGKPEEEYKRLMKDLF